MVTQILHDNPIDPGLDRFCQPVATDPMADAATWADDYRATHPATGNWHFIDIPRGAAKGSFTCDPATSCITLALAAQIKILQRRAPLPPIRRTRCDSSSTLRATSISRCTAPPTTTAAATASRSRSSAKSRTRPTQQPQATRSISTECGILQLVERIENGQTVAQFADALNTKYKSKFAAWEAAGINFDDWAWASHEDAETISYGKLSKKIAIETPEPVTTCADANHISTRMLALNEKVGPVYQSHVAATIQEQLARGGLRLSMILNQIWP